MRYLVRARVKADREADLLKAIDSGALGHGSVAEGEYLRNMQTLASAKTGPHAGSRSATAQRRCRKSGPTGNSFSTSPESRTRMTGANAATTTALNPGLVTDVTAPHGWKRS